MPEERPPRRGAQQSGTVGAIEIYENYGPRVIEIPLGADIVDTCFLAHDLWEDRGERVRVRVIRWEDGIPTCVLHLPPME